MQQIVKSTLIVGQVFKNYKVMCQALKQIPKKGDSKKSQVKEFKRYFDWEQKGQQCIVTVIYDTPREKIDNRGKSINSLKALNDNRSHRTRVIDIELLKVGYHYISLQQKETLSPFDTFLQLGLCNNYASQILYNKQDLLYNKNSPFRDCDIKVIDIVLNNLYNSMKNKVLCQYVTNCKMIIYTENDISFSRLATSEEVITIKEVENEVIQTYNERHDTSFKKYSDIYIYATKEQKRSISDMKKSRLAEELTNYDNDMSCLILDDSVKNIDIDVGQLEEIKRQINTLFYENEKSRIIKYYDEQIDKVRHDSTKSFGNVKIRKIKQLEENKLYSLKLLDYVLKLDLTDEEHKILRKMLC